MVMPTVWLEHHPRVARRRNALQHLLVEGRAGACARRVHDRRLAGDGDGLLHRRDLERRVHLCREAGLDAHTLANDGPEARELEAQVVEADRQVWKAEASGFAGDRGQRLQQRSSPRHAPAANGHVNRDELPVCCRHR